MPTYKFTRKSLAGRIEKIIGEPPWLEVSGDAVEVKTKKILTPGELNLLEAEVRDWQK
jgi:hypothetical protein